MGIQGLLPQLKPIQNPVTLRRYEGQTLGIDGYAWLHKAAYSCAYELVMGEPTERYLNFFIKRFALLKAFNIQPYLVFDGDGVPVKKGTETKRREKRIENKEIAQRLWKSGEKKNAMEYFQKCVDITPSMAKCVIDYCNTNNIKYIVAPFEADPQMVYLENKGLIHGIISEDSDLLVFGCRRLITKLNEFGECIEICRDDFGKLPNKFPLGQLSDEEIRTMVCLSGCDYTDGIPKVGLVTAMKLVSRMRDIKRIVLHIQREGKLKVPRDFLKEYERASYGFLYQRVFCPLSKRIVSFHDIPDTLSLSSPHRETISTCIGSVINKQTHEKMILFNEEDIDHHVHLKQAMGELDPYDYNKPLISRERVLQLSSKSEIITRHDNAPFKDVTNIKRKRPATKSIDSFFRPTTGPSITVNSNNKSYTMSSYNLGTSLIPKFVDKQVETVKKRKLIKQDDENIQIEDSIQSTSKFFSKKDIKKKELKVLEQISPQHVCNIDSELNSSRASTIVDNNFSHETSEDECSTDVPESEISTDIPSSFPLNIRDNQSGMHSVSRSDTPLAYVTEERHLRNYSFNRAVNSTNNSSKIRGIFRSVTRSSSEISSFDTCGVIGDDGNHPDQENIQSKELIGALSIKKSDESEIYLARQDKQISMMDKIYGTSTRASALQSFRYSAVKEQSRRRDPLKSNDINQKSIVTRTLKASASIVKPRRRMSGSKNNGYIMENIENIPDLHTENKGLTGSHTPCEINVEDRVNEYNYHENTGTIERKQNRIHVKINGKNSSMKSQLDTSMPLKRSVSLLSQFRYKGK
ncbi:similar to Saccharomyces cerevisiae YDR263C DIN7 Mitochondrial nuclease functioning in DNA repair and replication [Maudiozyma barnettii]|uniref:Similar to Saccharomyces cerevisiae YDR263C DIN7 Mitochondrial nuclease functioning in DNA repair and replication n=1 Tax=Maudiozyma barnettii TaxID=61262 RepID=A0A8H2VJ34_9SACH|nr:uncharacterized protein KABA2_09S01540 [Kazachstania barnettii]CAB4256300.1 similar to Saccharomyces cerevisiae YDR263C DIN7 Mitochondrial nuclease functioning in DNA repair and replication [Kazachstania barnettii]CAD1784909.1 similar to Saccharomyces cerevisiae YDR263C DIN7 Mitochondrial nuclease functioning in DNA repair and replication [Kazachstania barnettii]